MYIEYTDCKERNINWEQVFSSLVETHGSIFKFVGLF